MHVNDIGISGGPLSQATVDNILTSRFPQLHTLELALDEEEEVQPYDVPEVFFADNGFPALERFGMDWLKPVVEPHRVCPVAHPRSTRLMATGKPLVRLTARCAV